MLFVHTLRARETRDQNFPQFLSLLRAAYTGLENSFSGKTVTHFTLVGIAF